MRTGVPRFGVRPQGYYASIDLASGKEGTVFGKGAEERVMLKDKAFASLGLLRRVRKHAALGLLQTKR